MAKKPAFMRIDFDRESWPYFFYNRLTVTTEKIYLNIPIPGGFYYMLQRFTGRYPSLNANVPGVLANPVQISTFIESGKTALQRHAVDIPLICSPGEAGITLDLTNPARPMSAYPLSFSPRQNVLFLYRNVIQLEITNITVAAAVDFSLPAYIDLCLMGRYYPDMNQDQWRGTGS